MGRLLLLIIFVIISLSAPPKITNVVFSAAEMALFMRADAISLQFQGYDFTEQEKTNEFKAILFNYRHCERYYDEMFEKIKVDRQTALRNQNQNKVQECDEKLKKVLQRKQKDCLQQKNKQLKIYRNKVLQKRLLKQKDKKIKQQQQIKQNQERQRRKMERQRKKRRQQKQQERQQKRIRQFQEQKGIQQQQNRKQRQIQQLFQRRKREEEKKKKQQAQRRAKQEQKKQQQATLSSLDIQKKKQRLQIERIKMLEQRARKYRQSKERQKQRQEQQQEQKLKEVEQKQRLKGRISNKTVSYRFDASCHQIPHPQKRDKGGEDVCYVSSNLLIVADGIGGMAAYGIDPAIYPKKLVASMVRLFDQNTIQFKDKPIHLLRTAWELNKDVQGSTTITILMLNPDTGEFRVIYIGDSVYAIFNGLSREVAQPSMINFLTPHQINSRRFTGEKQKIFTAEEFDSEDVIVVASDGLWDNMFVTQIEKMALNDRLSLGKRAQELAQTAVTNYMTPQFVSPFYLNSVRIGTPISSVRGKRDDVTVIIAKIIKQVK